MKLKIFVVLLLVLAAAVAIGTQTTLPAKAQLTIPSDISQYALPGGTVVWYADYSTGNQSQLEPTPVGGGGGELLQTCTSGTIGISSAADGGITHNGEPYAGYYSGVGPSIGGVDGGACHETPDTWDFGGQPSYTSFYEEAWIYVPTQTLQTANSPWISFGGYGAESPSGDTFGINTEYGNRQIVVWSVSMNQAFYQNVGATVQWPFNQWFQIGFMVQNLGTSAASFQLYFDGVEIMTYSNAPVTPTGLYASHWGCYFSASQESETIYNADILLEDMSGSSAAPTTVPTQTTTPTTSTATVSPPSTTPISEFPSLSLTLIIVAFIPICMSQIRPRKEHLT